MGLVSLACKNRRNEVVGDFEKGHKKALLSKRKKIPNLHLDKRPARPKIERDDAFSSTTQEKKAFSPKKRLAFSFIHSLARSKLGAKNFVLLLQYYVV